MKTNLFLATGLLFSALGFCQNTIVPSSSGGYGTDNVYVGHQAGDNPSNTGDYNVFTGYQAGYSNTNGEYNLFDGYNAGKFNTSGRYNSFIGSKSGENNTTGRSNLFVGAQAGQANINQNNNVYIGFLAGKNILGEYNVITGSEAGAESQGNENNYYGYRAGRNANGNKNIFIGREAGRYTTGDKNIFIGHEAGMNASGNNKLYIANSNTANPLIYGDFSLKQLKLNGRVGIGYNNFGDFPNLVPTASPNVSNYSLFVKGGILTEEVRVRNVTQWPDYVFLKDYKLLSLKETEQYISDNGHLPNMPSADHVEKEGIEFGNIAKLQQEKIEELTLHLIEQNKKIEALQEQVQQLLNKK